MKVCGKQHTLCTMLHVARYSMLSAMLRVCDAETSEFCNIVLSILTLTLLDLTKSYKNYLQNTQHAVLHNRPTLSIGTERLV